MLRRNCRSSDKATLGAILESVRSVFSFKNTWLILIAQGGMVGPDHDVHGSVGRAISQSPIRTGAEGGGDDLFDHDHLLGGRQPGVSARFPTRSGSASRLI